MTALAVSATLPFASCISLNVNDEGTTTPQTLILGVGTDSLSASIRNAAATYAYNLMTYYTNNQTDTPATKIGNLPAPYYWWEAGAVWGGLVDYWAYTNDSSYVNTTVQALVANFGPNADLMVPAHRGDEVC